MSGDKRRLEYIDWARGLACLLMFQGHAYDAWLGPAERPGELFQYSQLLGTFPAPIFLFLAGVSMALGVERLEAKGVAGSQIARCVARRGLQIFARGLLFRLQEYAIMFPRAPWTDLFRVDILNTIGLSLVATSAIPLAARGAWRQSVLSAALALLVALVTPLLWTTHKPDSLPWWLASYINGGHTDYIPRPWLFPLFPWAAFTFAGCAAGPMLFRCARTQRSRIGVLLLGSLGLALFFLARWLDSLPLSLYSLYDFWHTSPNFLLMRLGALLVILMLSYVWCAIKPGKLWSPVQQLGTTSLLVYWVHIEFIYGRFSLLPPGSSSIALASTRLAIITVLMTLLSVARKRTKGRGSALLQAVLVPRGKLQAASQS